MEGNTMNDTTTDPDQTDEDILTYTVSDEALEAAAGAGREPNTGTWGMMCFPRSMCGC
jgi:hypothetical protein